MKFDKNLCMGCMNELDENGKCHYCDYTDDTPYLKSYLAPRTVLNKRYIVGRMLSCNGEGASYICYDTVENVKAVIREYMPNTLCEREAGSNILKANADCLAKYKTFMSEFVDLNEELSKMRTIEHIVTPEDIFYDNNTVYVIYDYVEGVSLKKFLQSNKGYMSWEQVKKMFIPLFTAVSIFHNAGIIHRGISPENIVVTTDGTLMLTGFSISSIRTANTGLATEFYSGYTAPEQYSCLEWQGTWTDVYSIAAVLYRILTGIVPLDARTRTTNDTMPPASRINSRVPAHVSEVLAKAMRVRGKDRIQTITELVSQLFSSNHQMEHTKGATQTIPVIKPEKKDSGSDDENTNEESPKKTRNVLIAGGIIAGLCLALLVFLVYQLVSGLNKDDKNIKLDSSSEIVSSEALTTTTTTTINKDSKYGVGSIMPNLVNMEYDTVVRQLGNDFNIVPNFFYSDTVEKGIIVDQSIPVGSDYDPSWKNELVLKVSKGSELVEIPEYDDMYEKDYLSELDSLEIKYTVDKEYSDNVDDGKVVSTSKAPGEKINIKEGEVLRIVVSKGRYQPPVTTTTPTTTAPQTTPAPVTTPNTTAAQQNDSDQNQQGNNGGDQQGVSENEQNIQQ
ncbi:MAG: PASTA domain-containing protein [Oscillospiraceae bacterium]